MGHRTPHSADVARLVDAQASGSVHVGEIDEHEAVPMRSPSDLEGGEAKAAC
jgi:hypothetical protein